MRSSGRDDHLEVETVVHRLSKILIAAEEAFRRLHRGMTEQELDLLKLAATR
jgi:hypothetical protein